MEFKGYTIIELPKEKWQGTKIPMRYTTEEYYDINMKKEKDTYKIEMRKCKFDEPVTHSPEEYDFTNLIGKRLLRGGLLKRMVKKRNY